MSSPRFDAVSELKAGLLAKFGEEKNTQDVVDREVAAFISAKKKINVKDLNDLESTISRELGPPISHKARVCTSNPRPTQHSAIPSTRFPPRMQGLSVTPQPTHTARISFNLSPELFPVPQMTTIVQVTSGKRRGPTASPTMLFPRIDGSPVNVRESPEVSRNISPLDYGLSEELRFKGRDRKVVMLDARKADSWGRVLRWDSAQFALEEEAKKASRERKKRWYKEELDRQVLTKERSSPKEFGQPEGTSLAFTEDRLGKLNWGPAAISKHTSNLDMAVNEHQEKQRFFRHEKVLERKQLDEVVLRDMQERSARENSRKAILLSLKAFQMKTAADKLMERRVKEAESRARARSRIDKSRKMTEELEKRHAEVKQSTIRKVSEENRAKAFTRKERIREATMIGDFKLGEAEEKRVHASKLLQAHTAEVLHTQVIQQSERSKERKQLLDDQAELWALEKAQNDADAQARAEQKRRVRQELCDHYSEQIEAKKRKRREDCDFSPAELQLNRDIIEAASAFK